MLYEIEIRRRAEKDLSSLPKSDAQKIANAIFAFAVIPYKDFVRMQEELEDYHDLLELRRAKSDPRNQQGRAFNIVAAELGLKKKRA